jgi:FeS assembly SUF system regulator
MVLIMIIIRKRPSRRWYRETDLLRLNRMTDYAIVVLGALAHRRGEVLATAQIAELTGLSQPTVAKVAKHLQGGDLLVTKRGVKGGYLLPGRPEEISLVRIIESIEGPIAVNGCVDGAHDPCAVANCCFMSNQWNKVNAAIRAAIDDITLADLIDPSQLFTAPLAGPLGHAESTQADGVGA